MCLPVQAKRGYNTNAGDDYASGHMHSAFRCYQRFHRRDNLLD